MKANNKSSKKPVKKSVIGAPRYDDAKIKKMVAFLKGHTNQEVKEEFGCSAHYAGKLRKKHKIALPESSRVIGKPAKKASGKKGKSAANLL
jgi:hypothetical protein